MERGDGENFEKCSMCLGTLANAAFFMMNLTNFIVDAERPGSGKQPRRPIDSAPQSGPAFLSQPSAFGNRWEASTEEGRATTNRRQGRFIYLPPRPMGPAMGGTSEFGCFRFWISFPDCKLCNVYLTNNRNSVINK